MSSAPLLGGRYEVHAEIGAGGMATVHLGRQRGGAGFARVVAIKRMHPHLAKDSEVVAMFLDEARLASRIDHPNVVGILDVVESGAEVFLVMPYVAGASLNRVLACAKAPAPQPIALRIAHDALLGLSAAHQAVDERGAPLRLVHRDVSPHNLLVGADGTTRVLDFGVAKAEGRLQERTRTNETKGKIAYMAPEQVLCEPVDARTDVYAMGVCLWEMLAGRRAHEGPEPVIMRAIIEAPLPALPGEGAAELDALIARATAKDKAARFESAAAMAAAIQSLRLDRASRDTVAQWLRGHLGRELDRRAEIVVRIEAGEPPVEPVAREVVTPASAVPVAPTTPISATVPSSSRRTPLLLAAAALALLATVMAWLATRPDAGAPAPRPSESELATVDPSARGAPEPATSLSPSVSPLDPEKPAPSLPVDAKGRPPPERQPKASAAPAQSGSQGQRRETLF